MPIPRWQNRSTISSPGLRDESDDVRDTVAVVRTEIHTRDSEDRNFSPLNDLGSWVSVLKLSRFRV